MELEIFIYMCWITLLFEFQINQDLGQTSILQDVEKVPLTFSKILKAMHSMVKEFSEEFKDILQLIA